MRISRNLEADRFRDAKRAKRFETFRDATAAPASIASSKSRVGQVAGVSLDLENWSSTGIIHWNPPGALPYPEVPPTVAAPGLDANSDKTEEEKRGCENASFAASNMLPITSGRRIAFQHGILSGACTWQYPLPIFLTDGSGGRIIGNTQSLATYEEQAASFREQIPSNTNGWVLVGHSNGGVISRYLAQTQPSGFAKAVITINSPHAGARIVNRVAGVLSNLQWLTSAASTIYSRRSLGETSMAALVSPNSVLRRIFNGGLVVEQMAPGSGFLAQLSTRPEAAFRRYAIRSQVTAEWQSVRVACDMRTSTSPSVPQGRRCVEDTKRYVKRAGFKVGVLAILSYVASLTPYINIFSASLTYVAKTYATVLTLMYAVDWAWRDAFSSNEPSDGVVPMSSQRWPNADAERVIVGADSHVGSTKSDKVASEVRILINAAYR